MPGGWLRKVVVRCALRFVCGAAAALPLGVVAQAQPEQLQEGTATGTFAVYHSDQPWLPVSFEYPAGWQVEPSSGTTEAYSQVQIYAPASVENRLRSYLVVRMFPTQDRGGPYASVQEMVDSYRKTLLPTLKIDKEEQIEVQGVPAMCLDVSGTMRLPWNSQKARPIPAKSQRVFLGKSRWLYEIAWTATPEAAPEVEAAFARLLKTLTLGR